jgi:site-specific DNA recombinase
VIRLGSAWLYARKSSYRGRKKDRGRSVREQLDDEREWCEENEVPVAGEFIDDDRSASPMADAPREEFERMIEWIASGRIPRGDVVVAWETSRLHRDIEIYVKLRNACWKAGVYWCLNGDLYDLSKRVDRKRSAQEAVEAEDQAYEISERVTRALRANARDGRPHGKHLYGYVRHYDPRTGELVGVEVDPEKARVVDELFDRVRVHHKYGAIMRDLNGRGVLSPSETCCNALIGAELARLRATAGLSADDVARVMRWKPARVEQVEEARWGVHLDDLERLCELYGAEDPIRGELVDLWRETPQWTKSAQIISIVTNPAYIGRRIHKGQDVGEAIWPKIVDEEKFYAVQMILSDPSRRVDHSNIRTHLLSGLASCSITRCAGVARSGMNTSGAFRVYRCDPHRHFQVPSDAVEKYVVAQLVLRFARHDAPELFALDGGDDTEVRRLTADIASWEADLAEAERSVAAKRLTVARLSNLEALINPQIETARKKLARLRVDPLLGALIKPDAEAVYGEWGRLSLSQQRAVIRSELKIVFSPMGRGRRHVPVEEYTHLSWRRDKFSSP